MKSSENVFDSLSGGLRKESVTTWSRGRRPWKTPTGSSTLLRLGNCTVGPRKYSTEQRGGAG